MFMFVQKYSVEGMYEKSAEAELEMMQKLRLTNGASTESHVCQCGLDPIGSMFCCSLCKIWIHCEYCIARSCRVFVNWKSNTPINMTEI